MARPLMTADLGKQGGTVVCFGEVLLRLGAPGREQLLQRPHLDVFVGGAEANVAVGLARLGHRVAMATVAADNALGHAALGELRRYGVSTDHAVLRPGRMGLYFLTTGAIHRPSDVLYDRAGSTFALAEPEAVDWDTALAGATLLHLSGINAALGENGAKAALRAVQAARAKGIAVSFDCNYRAKLWAEWGGDAPAIIGALLSHADVIFGGRRDFGLVLGRTFEGPDSPRAAADAAFAAFPQARWIASTTREQVTVDHHILSARLFTRDASHIADPVHVAPIVDRIGGGDAFAAGILHGLLTGRPERDVVRLGLAAAALKHGVPGDLALVSAGDMEGFLEGGAFDVRR
ncbi:PfkB family carbohydrate kinase [Pedomonas sp. V897]|uniref:PfkB family carbohydrate kinase n=1 Tax=Pedomonas sp. V897 TaxID=3446482 RepID=UPI003EDFF1B6